MTSDQIDIDVAIHVGTKDGICVSRTGNHIHATWLPRSHIKLEHKNRITFGTNSHGFTVQLATAVVTLSRKLAQEKGLL